MENLKIAIKGGGDIGSGIASKLYKANIINIYIMEDKKPKTIRKSVSFSNAIFSGKAKVNGISGILVRSHSGINKIINQKKIPIIVDPLAKSIKKTKPDVLIDSVMAKKNIVTSLNDANFVLGIGPGFTVNRNVHLVIETKRGHELGKVLTIGKTQENTFEPEKVENYSFDRVLRTKKKGILKANCEIGDIVKTSDVVCHIRNNIISSSITGIVRGFINSDSFVKRNTKIADIDSRAILHYCNSLSDKSSSIGNAVLGVILSNYNNIFKKNIYTY